MALTTKTLFPPIVNTTMPAFLRIGSCKVYFDLSAYNSLNDIDSHVQVIINNQNNNLSALKSELYPTGIKLTQMNSEMIDGVDKYYIIIDSSDLENGFVLNQYYKVQLCFINKNTIIPTEGLTSTWLANNQNNFSEWSSVCLIRGISTPILNIKGFDTEDEEQSVAIANQTVDFIGKLTFEEPESDSLEYYNIKLYKDNGLNELVSDSGIVYTNSYSPNDINYIFKKELEDGENYKAIFSYTTKARYHSEVTFNFSIILFNMEKLDVEITAEPEYEFGRIKLNVKSLTDEKFIGNLTIRRTDNKSDFTIWDDVNTDLISTGEVLNFIWYDNTVEAGVWYLYCVQKRNSRGDRGVITKIKQPVLCYFEDMFLVKENKSIRIKFDQQVSSWKRNLIESKTDTIGSKYPFIRRNANTDYRQFQISGLITRFMDINNNFTNEDELYGTSVKLYDDFNKINNISQYNDYIYEREFREKVLNFLHENDVTLFKTLTEGNVLVRLMDINISPVTTLGRRVYSFSASAYEIGEPTIENFTKYNVQNSGEVHPIVEYVSTTVGQLKNQTFSSGVNLVSMIQNQFAERSDSGFKNVVQSLNYLRIEIPASTGIPNPPHRLVFAKGQKLEYINSGLNNIVTNLGSILKRGTIITINGNDILIDESNFYELFDVEIKSLSFKGDTNAIVDYQCDIEKKEAGLAAANKFYYLHKVGQFIDSFIPNEYLVQRLKLKYTIDVVGQYYQKLSSINSLTIWAEPDTVIYIKDSLSTKYNRFVIGNDGVLEFNKVDTTIEDFYFKGINFKPKPKNRKIPLRHEYQLLFEEGAGFVATENKTALENAKEWTANYLKNEEFYRIQKERPELTREEIWKQIEYLNIKPQLLDRTVYWIDLDGTSQTVRHICLDGQLYIFPGPNAVEDVEIPVNAIIDYSIDVTKGEYANES